MLLNKDYDISLYRKVIDYNKSRYFAFRNGEIIEKNDLYERILSARYMKISRIHRRFVYLLTRCSYVWFCTFTFSNDYIDKCDRTKRDLIKSVINTHDFLYIVNVDYGKNTEREHYHCIIGTNINFDVNQYIQSFYPCYCLAIPCKKGINDYKRLSKYIDKLTNHCLKDTTKGRRMLYNFKGYDVFESSLGTFYYHIDRDLLFGTKSVGLLDKANTTGKIVDNF